MVAFKIAYEIAEVVVRPLLIFAVLCVCCTVLIFKSWLSENNVKIGCPIYLGLSLQNMNLQRAVKIDSQFFELLGGGIFQI